MSDIEVPIVQISSIEPIEGADRIEVAVAFDYRSIVGKGDFVPGDLAAYLPVDALLPDWLVTKLGLAGKLGGNNRIRVVRLRGVLSQGILYKIENGKIDVDGTLHDVDLDQDVCDLLGVRKVQHNAPRKFYGNCIHLDFLPRKYDIENLKRYPNVIEEGTPVRITEKMHGTLACIGFKRGLNHPELWGDYFTFSKGLGGSGNVFKNTEENRDNPYVRNLEQNLIGSNMRQVIDILNLDSVYIYGEIFGRGIQDLQYGTDPVFRVFDIYLGDKVTGKFVDDALMDAICYHIRLKTVPVLYTGPYSRDMVDSLCSGNTTFNDTNQIREGVVITPLIEQTHRKLGRVILKHINPDYLLRKGGTEFN